MIAENLGPGNPFKWSKTPIEERERGKKEACEQLIILAHLNGDDRLKV